MTHGLFPNLTPAMIRPVEVQICGIFLYENKCDVGCIFKYMRQCWFGGDMVTPGIKWTITLSIISISKITFLPSASVYTPICMSH